MEIDGRIIRQMVLFTLIVLIVPMILFPILLGTEFMKSSLMKATLEFAMLEFVFYGFAVYFFNKETSLTRLISNAAICIVGRYFIGAILGLLIAVMYAMNIGVALKFGAVSFWPAVAFHILTTPFILKPLFSVQRENAKPRQHRAQPESVEKNQFETTASFAPTSDKRKKGHVQIQTDYSEFQAQKPTHSKTSQTADGFQSAVNYIGENGTVLMAAVVDVEGLLLSSYQRAMFNAEDVAPLVLPIVEANKITLHKMKLPLPEKTNMMFENQRMVIATEKYYTLVVISERSADDVLNIRINQALEMIRIYTAERYSEELIGNAERIYV